MLKEHEVRKNNPYCKKYPYHRHKWKPMDKLTPMEWAILPRGTNLHTLQKCEICQMGKGELND